MRGRFAFALAWLVPALLVRAEDSGPPAGLAKTAWAMTGAVLDHHVDPPPRQTILMAGFRAVQGAAKVETAPGLALRLSGTTDEAGFTAVLAATWPKAGPGTPDPASLAATFLEGMAAAIPGDAEYVRPRDVRVNEQMAGNRYVGIHIAVGTDPNSKQIKIDQAMEGGPAADAGLMPGDLFETIEGRDVRAASIRELVDILRGEDGTSVTVTVRRGASRIIETRMTRRPLFRPTVEGIASRGKADRPFRLDGPDPIGYLKVREILASTAREIRELAPRLQSDGVKALVIDLRSTGGEDAPAAVQVADLLLESGLIGRSETLGPDPGSPSGLAVKETAYTADPDGLFLDWPIVVLVDGETRGVASWLAGSFLANRRARLVGGPLDPSRTIRTSVPVGDGLGAIRIATTRLAPGGEPFGPIAGPDRGQAAVARVDPKPRRVARPEPGSGASGVDSRYAPTVPAPMPRPTPEQAISDAVKLLREALAGRPGDKVS